MLVRHECCGVGAPGSGGGGTPCATSQAGDGGALVLQDNLCAWVENTHRRVRKQEFFGGEYKEYIQ